MQFHLAKPLLARQTPWNYDFFRPTKRQKSTRTWRHSN